MSRILAVLLGLLALTSVNAREYEVGESQSCTIRIDRDGTFWWNLRRETPANLPIIVAVSQENESAEEVPGTQYLGERLTADLTDNPWLTVQVRIHPESPDVCLDSLLDVFNAVEDEFGNSVRYAMGDCPTWDFDGWTYSFRVGVCQFNQRDDRIMKAARDSLGLSESVAAGIADGERFAEALAAGKWEKYRRLFEKTFVPIADDEVIIEKYYEVPPQFPHGTAWRGCLTAFVYVNNCGIPDSADVSGQYREETIPEDVRMAVMEAVLKERYMPWSCTGVGYDGRAVVVRSCQEVVWDCYCYPTDGQSQ